MTARCGELQQPRLAQVRRLISLHVLHQAPAFRNRSRDYAAMVVALALAAIARPQSTRLVCCSCSQWGIAGGALGGGAFAG